MFGKFRHSRKNRNPLTAWSSRSRPLYDVSGVALDKEDRSKSVLVLGSAGFVGNRLCMRLAELGNKVTALGRSESLSSDGRIVRLRGSIEDRQLLRSFRKRHHRLLRRNDHTRDIGNRPGPGGHG